MSNALTDSEVLGWVNHPVTQHLKVQLEKKKAGLEKQLRKVGIIESLAQLSDIQRELDIIDIYLDAPSKLLKHLDPVENPTETRNF